MGQEALTHDWSFPWEALDIMIGGKSAIDMPRLQVADWQEATDFMCTYGYDPDHPKDQRKIHAVFVEALNFIEEHLLPFNVKRAPPDVVLNFEDIRSLVLFASDHETSSPIVQAWSCAILRVMHTIAHIEWINRRIKIDVARRQIERRFCQHIFTDDDGNQWLGDEKNRVLLEKLEWKNSKTRDSIIMKLLHKRANVAETIYDLLGVRIVTSRLCDTMLVVKYLMQFYMVTFPNCNPSRARNNLIDVKHFRQNLEMLLDMFEKGKLNEKELENMVEQIIKTPGGVTANDANPHSASNYRAIQLTCRQLIRSKNPTLIWIRKIEEYLGSEDGKPGVKESLAKLSEFVKSWPGLVEDQYIESFYPFEVQVMDAETFAVNQSGAAAHARYKQSQLRAARRRVLGPLLKMKKV